MKKINKYLLGVVLVVLIAVIAGKVLALNNNKILPSVFRDAKNGTVLTLQLVAGRSDTGEFYFFVPNQGYYQGIVPIKQNSNPQGTVTARFYPINGGSVGSATMILNGQVHQTSASIKITVNSTKYTLTTATVDPTAATTVANQALAYTTTKNWPSLYGLLSADVKASLTQTQFTQIMSDTTQPVVTNATLNGQGVTSDVGGYSYFTQPVTLTVKKPDGTTATYHANEYFILEQGNWRLLSTDTPTP